MRTLLAALLLATTTSTAHQAPQPDPWWTLSQNPTIHFVSSPDQALALLGSLRPGDLVQLDIDLAGLTAVCTSADAGEAGINVGPTFATFSPHVPVSTPDGTPPIDTPPELDDEPLPPV